MHVITKSLRKLAKQNLAKGPKKPDLSLIQFKTGLANYQYHQKIG